MNPYIVPGLAKDDLFSFQINKMIQIICTHCGVSVDTLKLNGRTKEVVKARHLCFYFMKHKPKMTLAMIARFFNKDHTTVLSAIRKINGFIKINDDDTIKSLKEVNELLGKSSISKTIDFAAPPKRNNSADLFKKQLIKTNTLCAYEDFICIPKSLTPQ